MAWAGKNESLISSFTGVLSTLYDDFEFQDFIKVSENLSDECNFYNQLVTLDNLIDNYKEYGYKVEQEEGGYEKILNDPKLEKITSLASEIIESYPEKFLTSF